jgi:hypothetical protein
VLTAAANEACFAVALVQKLVPALIPLDYAIDHMKVLHRCKVLLEGPSIHHGLVRFKMLAMELIESIHVLFHIRQYVCNLAGALRVQLVQQLVRWHDEFVDKALADPTLKFLHQPAGSEMGLQLGGMKLLNMQIHLFGARMRMKHVSDELAECLRVIRTQDPSHPQRHQAYHCLGMKPL